MVRSCWEAAQRPVCCDAYLLRNQAVKHFCPAVTFTRRSTPPPQCGGWTHACGVPHDQADADLCSALCQAAGVLVGTLRCGSIGMYRTPSSGVQASPQDVLLSTGTGALPRRPTTPWMAACSLVAGRWSPRGLLPSRGCLQPAALEKVMLAAPAAGCRGHRRSSRRLRPTKPSPRRCKKESKAYKSSYALIASGLIGAAYLAHPLSS